MIMLKKSVTNSLKCVSKKVEIGNSKKVEITDQSRGTYNTSSQIRFKF